MGRMIRTPLHPGVVYDFLLGHGIEIEGKFTVLFRSSEELLVRYTGPCTTHRIEGGLSTTVYPDGTKELHCHWYERYL